METTTILPNITMDSMEKPLLLFSWYDYAIFAIMLGFSAVIGIYFGCFGSKQSTTGEYLLGSKSMKVVPIVISLIASHTSGTTLLALPAEIYRFGATYWLISLTMIVIVLLTAHVYLPVFYNLQITSTYEYLEMRFDSKVRNFASFLFTISRLLFLPIVIYIPALACSSATGLNVHFITPLICGVCIFYTTIGGLKAVVWTDTFQFVITIGSVIAVLILGINATGGLGNVWKTAVEGHRLDIDFSPDPSKRDSFWAVTIGFTVHWLVITAIDQGCVQKFLSVSSMREAIWTIWLYGIGIALIKTLSVLAGLVMYAKYSTCDPLSNHAIKTSDQLLPYFVMEVAGTVPGLPGLFTVGVVSAGLSTLSANLNSFAAIFYKDFIAKLVSPNISEKAASNILKLIVVVVGTVCILLVFIVEQLGGILSLSIALGGVALGPTMGLFTLGMLVPRTNSKGAFWGSLVSCIAMSCIIFMAQYYKLVGALHHEAKPVTTVGCDITNSTSFNFSPTNTTTAALLHDDEPFVLFRISHYYYTVIGMIITMVVGYLVSIFSREENFVRAELVSPLVHWLIPKEKKPISELVDYTTVEKAMYIVASDEKE